MKLCVHIACLTKTTEPDSSSNTNEVQQAKKRTLISKPNEEDKNSFFEELSQSGGNSVILS